MSDNSLLNSYSKSHTVNWNDQEDYVRILHDKLINSDLYNEYMALSESTYASDKKFVEKFFTHIIAADEDFYSLMEEKSIYWNDEIEFIISMVVRTIKGFSQTDDTYASLMSLYKDRDDEDFVKTLLRKAIINHTDHLELIKANTNDDVEVVGVSGNEADGQGTPVTTGYQICDIQDNVAVSNTPTKVYQKYILDV